MLTNDQVNFCIVRMYPDLIPGRDYLLSSDWNDEGTRQLRDAKIDRWSVPIAPPSPSQIRKLWSIIRGDYEAAVAASKARARILEELRRSDSQVAAAIDYDDGLALRKWRSYRLNLREVPNQIGFPFNIEWPERPKEFYENFDTSVPDRNGVQGLCGANLAPGV